MFSARLILTSIIALLLLTSEVCHAGSWLDYLSQYRLAVELRGGNTATRLKYDTAQSVVTPDRCVPKLLNPSRMDCETTLLESRPVTYGLSLQQAFTRTGWFYSNFDFGLSYFALDAKSDPRDPLVLNPKPLQDARVHLYGINLKGYYQFGITPPQYLPDLLISVGLGGHYSHGNLKINALRQTVDVLSNIRMFQFELVWWRFRDGSLSSYAESESNVKDQKVRSSFQDYRNVALAPSQYSIGLLKLILPFKTK
ncbi:MAG: hypothetical protein H7249_04195 [Chitinophagaceae bacterium]|nr:hypothetical protein [Oligoflexus sp.]